MSPSQKTRLTLIRTAVAAAVTAVCTAAGAETFTQDTVIDRFTADPGKILAVKYCTLDVKEDIIVPASANHPVDMPYLYIREGTLNAAGNVSVTGSHSQADAVGLSVRHGTAAFAGGLTIDLTQSASEDAVKAAVAAGASPAVYATGFKSWPVEGTGDSTVTVSNDLNIRVTASAVAAPSAQRAEATAVSLTAGDTLTVTGNTRLFATADGGTDGHASYGIKVTDNAVFSARNGLEIEARYAFAGNGYISVAGPLVLKDKTIFSNWRDPDHNFTGTINFFGKGTTVLTRANGWGSSGHYIVHEGAELDVSDLLYTVQGDGSTVEVKGKHFNGIELKGGTLTAYAAQIFENPLSADGTGPDTVGSVIWGGMAEATGTLHFADDAVNRAYYASAKEANSFRNGLTLVWNKVLGLENIRNPNWDDAVDADGNIHIAGSTLDLNTDFTVGGSNNTYGTITGSATLKEVNVGDKTITVTGGKSLTVSDSISGRSVAVLSDGTLTLEGGEGCVGAAVTVAGRLAVDNGKYDFREEVALESGAVLDVTGEMTSLIARADGALLNVGSDTGAGVLVPRADSNLRGARVFLDPVTADGADQGSVYAVAGTTLDHQVIAGRNSTAMINTAAADTEAAKSAAAAAFDSFAKASKKSWEDGFAFAVINGEVTIDSTTGFLLVDSAADASATLGAGEVRVAADKSGLLMTEGATLTGSTLTVEDGATVVVAGRAEGDHVFTFDTIANDGFDIFINPFTTGAIDADGNVTNVKVTDANAVGGFYAPNMTNAVVQDSDLWTSLSGDMDALRAESNRVAEFGFSTGAQFAAINTTAAMTDTVEARALEARDPALMNNLWVDVNGHFARADKFGFAKNGIKSNMGGITFGYDFAVTDSAVLGAAVSAGKGSVKGQNAAAGTKNSIDYYGLTAYGSYDFDVAKVAGSVSWLQTKNDIKRHGISAQKPDTNTVTAAVRAEKAFTLSNALSVTPHAGIRYVRTDMDAFNNGDFRYDADVINLVQFPVGAAVNMAMPLANGHKLTAGLDLSVVPTAGDTKSDIRVSYGSGADSVEGRVASSALYQATFGADYKAGGHKFGASCGLGAGNGGRFDQAVRVNYRYTF